MSKKRQELIGTIDSDDEDNTETIDISKDKDLGFKGKNVLKKRKEIQEKRDKKKQMKKEKKEKKDRKGKGKNKGKNAKRKGKQIEESESDSDIEEEIEDEDDSDLEFAEEQENPESLSLVIEENEEEEEEDEESESESESDFENDDVEGSDDDDNDVAGSDANEKKDDNNNDDDDDENIEDFDDEFDEELEKTFYDDPESDDDVKDDVIKTEENPDKKKKKKTAVMTSSKLIRSKLAQHKALVLKSTGDDDASDTEEINKSDAIYTADPNNENEEERPEDDEYFEKACLVMSSKKKSEGILSSEKSIKNENDDSFIVPFEEMNLSKGMLRSIKAMGFTRPTSIQSAAITLALTGKDICANAATGSGKTAAFLIPIIERLVQSAGAVTSSSSARCVILTPTRELAVQCENVFERLAAHTNLTHVLVVGGVSSATQLKFLQGGVDVVIATPGRLIDHVLNSPDVLFKNTEILVLDEADQLLDMGFIRQVEEIAKACSSKERRQTLLFSATMTSEVDKLAKLALRRPVWLSVDKKYDMNSELTHELVRLPEGEAGNRDTSRQRYVTRVAHLLALCKTQLRTKTLVFCESKQTAHRVMLYMTLAGFAVTDLHGDLTHVQRMAALHKFREGEVDFLVSTDLAARGLDIEGVKGVINFQLPRSLCRYVHRVGRTARAGRDGRAISLVGRADSELLKQVVNHSKGRVVRRKVPDAFVQKCIKQVNDTESDVNEIVSLEADEKANNEAMRDVKRAENLIIHRDEIMANPRKTWFMTRAEKRKLEAEEREAERKRRKIEKDGDKEEGKKAEGRKEKRVKKEIARDQKLQERKKLQAERELREAYRSAKMAKREAHHAKKGAPEGRGIKGASKADRKRGSGGAKQRQLKSRRGGDDSGLKKPKLHLGKKRSNNQFKSKKRFKRR